jgi:ferredoxin, 2Fe-2S
MAVIVIANWGNKTVHVTDTRQPLLRHFQENRLDWMHACGGKGRCTTCKVIVVKGDEHLSHVTPAENRYRAMGALKENERLSCQVRISGDITIEVPDEYKLPHINYS